MKTIGVGMVGYGFMGKTHTYAYKSISMIYEPAPADIRLVGVAVRSEASQKLAVEQGGYEFATNDYRKLLERDDIDAINVCTPNDTHRDIVIDAIKAGKHVYVDKPLALNLEQAEEIIRAEREAEAAGSHRTRQMVQNNRFIPATMRAKELIDDGRLGRIYTFNFRFLHSSMADPTRPANWKSSKAQGGGGTLVDLGEHIFDLCRFLLGDFKRVCAFPMTMIPERPDGRGGIQIVDTGDQAYVMAELKSGAVGTFETSKVAVGSNDEMSFEIRGEKGALMFNLMDPNWLKFYDNTRPDEPLGGEKGFLHIESTQRYPKPSALPGPKSAVGWTRFHIESLYEFVRRCAAGEPGNPSLSDGLAAQRVIDACYRSSGRWTDIGG